jgi:hypothetical protein
MCSNNPPQLGQILDWCSLSIMDVIPMIEKAGGTVELRDAREDSKGVMHFWYLVCLLDHMAGIQTRLVDQETIEYVLVIA